MTRRFEIVYTGDAPRWREVVESCPVYDVYHLHGYHRLAEEQGDVQALLFVYHDGPAVIAMPLLQRAVDDVDGLRGEGYLDITSVYGYPGPIVNTSAIPPSVAAGFASSFHNYLDDRRVVTAFSRLHPLIDGSPLLADVGDVLDVGPTVGIDLRLPSEEQVQQYRDGHQYDIDKARKNDVVCIHDKDWDYLDRFVDVYLDTMRRVHADKYYFFDRTYFTRLRDLLGKHLHLFAALTNGEMISGSLFTICNGIIEYHLSGTDSEHLDLAPSKLILDEVRLWGNEIGAQTFHLGGGVGGKEDGVFRFKAGFSAQVHRFRIWRAVVNREAYKDLTEQKKAWNEEQNLAVSDEGYFPAYRAPTQRKG